MPLRAALLLVTLLALSGCRDRALDEQCARLSDWHNTSGSRAQRTVPEAERVAAKTKADVAAWYRKLARGYEVEATTPPQFTHPRVREYETKIKATYLANAAALRKQADGFDKGDDALHAEGVKEDGAASLARQAVLDEWMHHCRVR